MAYSPYMSTKCCEGFESSGQYQAGAYYPSPGSQSIGPDPVNMDGLTLSDFKADGLLSTGNMQLLQDYEPQESWSATNNWSAVAPFAISNPSSTPTLEADRSLSPESEAAAFSCTNQILPEGINAIMDGFHNPMTPMGSTLAPSSSSGSAYGGEFASHDEPLPGDFDPLNPMISNVGHHQSTSAGLIASPFPNFRTLTPSSEVSTLGSIHVQTVSPLLLSNKLPITAPAQPNASKKPKKQKNVKKTRVSGRVQKRQSPKAKAVPSITPPKRKIDNNSQTTSPFSCKRCSTTFLDNTSLEKHIKAYHSRPFLCIFGFAGCSQTFATKNEWKRHIVIQHICPTYFHCTYNHCPKMGAGSRDHAYLPTYGKVFARKDLYDQHFRRVHTGDLSNFSSEEQFELKRSLTSSSHRRRCELPTNILCPASDCDQRFRGEKAWDQMLEHVARHMELADGGVESPVSFEDQKGASLTNWASSEEVKAIQTRGAGWEFCYPPKTKNSKKRN